MLKGKKNLTNQGFTLLEVIAAILIMTIFISVSLQAMAISVILKVRARENTEAMTWIQEDLENTRFKADTYQYTSLTTAGAAKDSTTITVNSDPINIGFDNTTNNKILVGSDGTTYTISSISGYILTITPALKKAAQGNDVVAGIARCPSIATLTRTTGFADGLRDKIIGSDQTTNDSTPTAQTRTMTGTGTTFHVSKTLTLKDEIPYNQIQINYTVTPTTGGKVRAKNFIEIIPRAAYACPS